ncbi:helix-turn-helix domain-containing protein [Micromonospora sp. LOL_014]|uniref:helix-turn-helix domain-containing protein n=1 Tax=Micromonospora sp. LOL_014 TaxID=3345415 RepID=UPI003A8378D4
MSDAPGQELWPLLAKDVDSEVRWGFQDARVRANLISQLTDLRRQLALSTAELARRSGMPEHAIVEFEAGSADYSVEFVQRLCRSMGVRLALSLEADAQSPPEGTASLATIARRQWEISPAQPWLQAAEPDE